MHPTNKIVVYIAWTIALVATLGSLFFSNILNYPPCTLCWYQRILMYPLVFVLAVGLLSNDKKLHYYALPLSIAGAAVAAYHVLLYVNVIPETLAPCTVGVSCTTKQIEWLGFISIPLMSMLAFLAITACMVYFAKKQKKFSQ